MRPKASSCSRQRSRTVGRTGVELEAMTAAAVAALTVYDMVKGVERGVTVERVALIAKSGGRSGEWRRGDEPRTRRPEVESPRTAIVTVSTSKSRGEGEDLSGNSLAELVARLGGEVAGREMIADDSELIAERLRHWADEVGCALVLTSGGTGFAPTDVTPEATRAVIEREAPASRRRCGSPPASTLATGCSRVASPGSVDRP